MEEIKIPDAEFKTMLIKILNVFKEAMNDLSENLKR